MLQRATWDPRVMEWVRNIWREAAAFGVVGAVAFVVEFAAFNVLISGTPFSRDGVLRSAPVVASALATGLAMAVSWWGNRHWTYRSHKQRVTRREVGWFVGINLAGLAITAAPVYVSHELLGLDSAWSDNVARLVGWAAATGVRFAVYRTRVFAGSGPACAGSTAPAEAGPGRGPAAAEAGPGRGPAAAEDGPGRGPTASRAGRRAWPWWLAALAALCGYAVATVFHPGFLSPDSADQLRQALNERPVTDWHPPVMVVLWRVLIHLTGAMSAMAALQVAVVWGSLWALAVTLWHRTGSRGLSLAVLGAGLAPHVVNLTGVVWKDVHMAYALLAACALALVARELPQGRHNGPRWALLVLGVLFLAYAMLVRKNGILAVAPVFVLLVLAARPATRSGRRRWLVATGLFVAVTIGGSVAVSAATTPVATRQYAQIPLDDLVHVLTPGQVRAAAERAGAGPEFRDRLVTAAERCRSRGVTSDAYFRCYPRDPSLGSTELGDQADVLVRMWTRQMPRHWTGYAEYRLRVFAKLLFQGNQAFQNGTTTGARTIPAVASAPVNDQLTAMLRNYVTGFVRDVPFLFQGWFWLALSLVLALRRRWPGPYAREIRLLGASGALYILAYLPTAPESNYRYVYWPAIAGTLALLLVLAAFVLRRRAARSEAVGDGDTTTGDSDRAPSIEPDDPSPAR
ncbi:GtrA family protein [Streptomyces sp. NPDC049813]|uniref:GtrA family protein n=1 Tax=Streptomyces sp. NPDC049813 TaxID=3365597 RepID=UPI0037A55E8A